MREAFAQTSAITEVAVVAEQNQADKLTKPEAFFTGGFARATAAAVTCPFTVVKTRMEYAGSSVQYTVSPSRCHLAICYISTVQSAF